MTITLSGIGALSAFAAVFAVVFASVTLWRRRVPGLPAASALGAALYLFRYAVALEYYGLRRSEISSHVEALRADLGAIEPDGVSATLQGLGPPRSLAAEVTDGMLRPSLLRGAIWFSVALVATFVVAVIAAEAFLAAFEAVAEPGAQASWTGPGLVLDATMGSDGRASSIGIGGAGFIFVPIAGFVVGGRLWRALGRLRNRSTSAPILGL